MAEISGYEDAGFQARCLERERLAAGLEGLFHARDEAAREIGKIAAEVILSRCWSEADALLMELSIQQGELARVIGLIGLQEKLLDDCR